MTPYDLALERAEALSRSLVGLSTMQRLARLPREKREEVLSTLGVHDRARLLYYWAVWARPKQLLSHLPPSLIKFLMFGRGTGKSRTCAERIKERVYQGARHIALIGPTLGDVEKYMVGTEGQESGLLQIFHPSHRPQYVGGSVRAVRFHTGAVAQCVTAEKPEFRGSNLDTVWLDEIAQFPHLKTIWDNLEYSTRSGSSGLPLEILVSSTPLPMEFLKGLIADPDCVTLFGSMYENEGNVPQSWLDRMRRKFEGTRQGEQEIHGRLLGDNPNALWAASTLDTHRVPHAPPGLRTAVAVDPAIATNKDNDETGIIIVGIDARDHLYVLGDRSGRYTPTEWAKEVVEAYDKYGCSSIVVERNRGGDLVGANIRAYAEKTKGTLRADALPIVEVHAREGKSIRAEPVATLTERGRLHIVGGLPTLEMEMTDWNPALTRVSPNRIDALVMAVTHLADLSDDAPADPTANVRGWADHVTARLDAAATQPAPRQDLSRPMARRPLHPGGGRGRIA